ncbi:trihelix transcription factor ASIL2 [Forsythia ovata]|uniref:Trihelix transcription factor ASIL2 n=1 Tax=Forsythia ovata TaxID=205694 RepID=A0ABD1RQT2_9LAMI
MATIFSPSSPSANDDHIPTATLALPLIAITAASASRRLLSLCWSTNETVALIDVYKDKWYSLRRGNLRAFHWQEVANDVAYRCPSNPAKTSVQCRHKMENSASAIVLRSRVLPHLVAQSILILLGLLQRMHSVAAIRDLGKGFMKMENVKMDMARMVEEMRI